MPFDGTLDLVYFRVIVSDDSENGDIISIAAIHGVRRFIVWVRPSKPVPSTALPIQYGLRLRYLDWFWMNRKLRTLSLIKALIEFLLFLKGSRNRVLLVGHNAKFQIMHLVRAIRNTGMIDSFDGDILGFVDTLQIFRRKFPNRGPLSQYLLPALCRDLLYTEYTGHPLNSIYGMEVLENLVINEISTVELAEVGISYEDAHRIFSETRSLAFA